MWRAAQKRMDLEQTESFDYKGNTGFEKRVKIHSSEFHETLIEEEEEEERAEERDTVSEGQWEAEHHLDRREGRERREYRNYNYETDYIDNREVDWGHHRDSRDHYDSWERRRGYSQGYYQEDDWREDYYYGHYGYQRWREQDHYHDGHPHQTNRRWSYDSYYDKVLSNTNTKSNMLNAFIVKQMFCFI